MERSGLRFEKNAKKGCKIAAQKNCFGANFASLSRIFFGICVLTPFNGLFCPPSSQSLMCTFFFDFRNSWKKVMKRSGLKTFPQKGCKLPRRIFSSLDFCLISSLRSNGITPHFPKSNVQTF